MDSYGDLLFTPNVRAEQDKVGMGARYAQSYATRLRDPLDADTRAFIESRDSFYMATLSETGWPYVQHRGGLPGFLKVTGPEQLSMADYRGNKQFISRGNLTGSDRVSLFLMDYPRRARLKLMGHARMVEATDAPDLVAELHRDGDPEAERILTIDLVAMDWNCPKYITPRFTEEELQPIISPRFAELSGYIKTLEAKLDAADPNWADTNWADTNRKDPTP